MRGQVVKTEQPLGKVFDQCIIPFLCFSLCFSAKLVCNDVTNVLASRYIRLRMLNMRLIGFEPET